MTLQTSGTITAAQINVELDKTPTAYFALGGVEERELAQVPTGTISMDDFYGKSNVKEVIFDNSGGVWGSPADWNISSVLAYLGISLTKNMKIIFRNIIFNASSTSAWALQTGSGWLAGTKLVVEFQSGSSVRGKGGAGAGGGYNYGAGGAGGGGGPAYLITSAISGGTITSTLNGGTVLAAAGFDIETSRLLDIKEFIMARCQMTSGEAEICLYHLKPLIGAMLEHIERTGLNISWWIAFTTLWDYDIYHMPFIFGYHPDDGCPFFNSDDFQRWALQDASAKIVPGDLCSKSQLRTITNKLLQCNFPLKKNYTNETTPGLTLPGFTEQFTTKFKVIWEDLTYEVK